jgi:nicotinate-nucleotide pyrophosphorylase (carboxylating)
MWQRALAEDVGAGDLTADLVDPAAAHGGARVLAREPAVICGSPLGAGGGA